MGIFPQTISCNPTTYSSTSTPSIDEDCNGRFDNMELVENDIGPKTIGTSFNCGAGSVTQSGKTYLFWRMSFRTAGQISSQRYNEASCSTTSGPQIDSYESNRITSLTGTVPNDDNGGMQINTSACQPWIGSYYQKVLTPVSSWGEAKCQYRIFY